MIKVNGEISEIAICTIDSDSYISGLSRNFFTELSLKVTTGPLRLWCRGQGHGVEVVMSRSRAWFRDHGDEVMVEGVVTRAWCRGQGVEIKVSRSRACCLDYGVEIKVSRCSVEVEVFSIIKFFII